MGWNSQGSSDDFGDNYVFSNRIKGRGKTKRRKEGTEREPITKVLVRVYLEDMNLEIKSRSKGSLGLDTVNDFKLTRYLPLYPKFDGDELKISVT